eukprot:1391863-Amorphochlora_amoeboformis.AAC.1
MSCIVWDGSKLFGMGVKVNMERAAAWYYNAAKYRHYRTLDVWAGGGGDLSRVGIDPHHLYTHESHLKHTRMPMSYTRMSMLHTRTSMSHTRTSMSHARMTMSYDAHTSDVYVSHE